MNLDTAHIGFIVGCLGVWVTADGVASLYTYCFTDKAHNQDFFKDHLLRILRCVMGITLVFLAWFLIGG